jgi:outer membrane lipoprotein-sorting protein
MTNKLLASCLLAAAATAALADAPAPTVDSIVADYVAARGGAAKIKSVQTLRQSGHAYADGGRQAIVLRELKRPNKSRFEFTVQGMTGVYVANGRDGWQVTPLEGSLEAKPMSPDAVTDALEQADIEGPLVDWKAKGHKVELDGRTKIRGREAYKLKVTLKSGAVRYDYIDVASHYEVRAESTREIGGHALHVTADFSNHKKTAGLLFPGTIEVTTVERPQKLRIVVDAVEVNPKIDDARFEKKH